MEDLESLKTWKAKELMTECQRQGAFWLVGWKLLGLKGWWWDVVLFSLFSDTFLWLNENLDGVFKHFFIFTPGEMIQFD